MAPRAPDGGARNFWTRIASAAVMAPAAIAAIWAGSPWFDLMIAAASAALAWEWARLCRYGRFELRRDWAFLALILAAVLVAVAGAPHLPVLAAVVALSVAWFVVGVARKVEAAGWFPLGFLLIAASCVSLISVRNLEAEGLRLTIWLFLVTWAVDTGGYIVGRLVGGPKLAPRISPKKTWSGLGGSLLAAIAVGLAYPYGVAAITTVASGMAAMIVGSAAVAGDLLESAAKRRFGLKDSSALIPGHGGLLDRVDGLLLAAPVAALMLSESWRWA